MPVNKGDTIVYGDLTVCGELIANISGGADSGEGVFDSINVTGDAIVFGNMTVCGQVFTPDRKPIISVTTSGTVSLTDTQSGSTVVVRALASGDLNIVLPASPPVGTYYRILFGDFNGSSNTFTLNAGGYMKLRGSINYGSNNHVISAASVSWSGGITNNFAVGHYIDIVFASGSPAFWIVSGLSLSDFTSTTSGL